MRDGAYLGIEFVIALAACAWTARYWEMQMVLPPDLCHSAATRCDIAHTLDGVFELLLEADCEACKNRKY